MKGYHRPRKLYLTMIVVHLTMHHVSLSPSLSLSLSLSLTLSHDQQSNLEKAITPPSTPTKTTFQSPKLLFQGGKPFTSNSLKKSAEDWELHPCQIIVEENLGQGGFGEVYQGTIRGGVGLYKSNCPQIMRVAVKVLRGMFDPLSIYKLFLDVQ